MNDKEIAVAFKTMTEGQERFTRRMAISLSDMCMCEVKPLIRRLEKLKLLKSGSWDWFVENGGFLKSHYEQARSEMGPNRVETSALSADSAA